MMKFDKMRRLWELRRVDFWLAMIALVGVLVVPTLEALGLAVAVSLGVLIWRSSDAAPDVPRAGRAAAWNPSTCGPSPVRRSQGC